MPAKSPLQNRTAAMQLAAIGARIRAQRKRLKVAAGTAAEAAGMSRVTLHRIERGEPSVTMGAYLSAVEALGLELALNDPQARAAAAESESAAVAGRGLPATIRLDDYPQLRRLAWQRSGTSGITPAEALSLYERNWRHVEPDLMEPGERALVEALALRLGGGRLLV